MILVNIVINRTVVIDDNPVSGLFDRSLSWLSFLLSSCSIFLPITLISRVAFTSEPSVDDAVIVALPSVIAVTIPSWFMVATFSLLLVHFITGFVASLGVIFASRTRYPPAITSFLPSILIFSTKILVWWSWDYFKCIFSSNIFISESYFICSSCCGSNYTINCIFIVIFCYCKFICYILII